MLRRLKGVIIFDNVITMVPASTASYTTIVKVVVIAAAGSAAGVYLPGTIN